MSLFATLEKRKLVYQFTGKNLEELCNKVKVAYIGMDATAPSIHAGYLIPIIFAQVLAEHGVKIIVLLGGGTTKVGDPTGKNTSRKMLDQSEIDKNSAGLLKSINKFFPNAIVVNNNDWLSKLSMIDYLTEIARYVSINSLVHNELFATRLSNNNPLSMLEMTYPILQGYDYLHLNREYGCNLEFGGSDQWNNMLMGVDLIKRIDGKEVDVMTCPLLLTSDGKKMGKSEKGAIWLDSDLCSVFDFWQYWRNIDDVDCERFLRLLLNYQGEMPENINDAKKMLATGLTTFVHGEQAALEAEAQAVKLFEKKDVNDLETVEINVSGLLDILVLLNLAFSKGEGKRLIEQGGISLNGIECTDIHTILENEVIIRKGKKQFVKVKIV